MKDFFVHPATQWRAEHGSLHVYLLPQPQQRAELAAVQDGLAGLRRGLPGGLHARQPAEFLHATVLRLPHFRQELDAAELRQLGAALDAALARVPAFNLVLDRLSVGRHGVVLAGATTAAWRALVEAVAGAARGALPRAEEWPGPPRGPHVSLTYGVAEADEDSPEVRAIEQTLPGGLTQRWRVEAAHLLAVAVDRARGNYTWEPVGSHRLGPVSTIDDTEGQE